MVIPDIQTQSLTSATFQPNVSTVDVIKSPNAVAAINTDSKSGSSTTGSDSSDTLSTEHGTKVTLSSDKARHAENGSSEKQNAETQRENASAAQSDYSLTMTGIPLYGGTLVSVIKYPNGQSEMFDASTGKRITQEDLALLNGIHGDSAEAIQVFESTGSFSGLSAAEVYQRIQELMGKAGTEDA